MYYHILWYEVTKIEYINLTFEHRIWHVWKFGVLLQYVLKISWLETLKFEKTSGDYSFHPEIAVEKVDDGHFDEIPQAIAKIALGADYNEKVFNEWRISYRQTKP